MLNSQWRGLIHKKKMEILSFTHPHVDPNLSAEHKNQSHCLPLNGQKKIFQISAFVLYRRKDCQKVFERHEWVNDEISLLFIISSDVDLLHLICLTLKRSPTTDTPQYIMYNNCHIWVQFWVKTISFLVTRRWESTIIDKKWLTSAQHKQI